jgi:hypothetical protein
VQTTLLRVLDISHTVRTLVGNGFVHDGTMGGEWKRVPIAEIVTTRMRV